MVLVHEPSEECLPAAVAPLGDELLRLLGEERPGDAGLASSSPEQAHQGPVRW